MGTPFPRVPAPLRPWLYRIWWNLCQWTDIPLSNMRIVNANLYAFSSHVGLLLFLSSSETNAKTLLHLNKVVHFRETLFLVFCSQTQPWPRIAQPMQVVTFKDTQTSTLLNMYLPEYFVLVQFFGGEVVPNRQLQKKASDCSAHKRYTQSCCQRSYLVACLLWRSPSRGDKLGQAVKEKNILNERLALSLPLPNH